MKRTPEEKLLNPRPGSKIAEAAEFGIDLTLTVSQLRKTPQQRIDDLQSAMKFQTALRKARRTRSTKNPQ
ncbi:MAG: hypothetical protein K1X52_12965 [Pyrinomonadaceae bacterium]|nr:hypothetical protein [Pyrinomonadaceae bacterium]